MTKNYTTPLYASGVFFFIFLLAAVVTTGPDILLAIEAIWTTAMENAGKAVLALRIGEVTVAFVELGLGFWSWIFTFMGVAFIATTLFRHFHEVFWVCVCQFAAMCGILLAIALAFIIDGLGGIMFLRRTTSDNIFFIVSIPTTLVAALCGAHLVGFVGLVSLFISGVFMVWAILIRAQPELEVKHRAD
jgi:hypothetical protein